MIPHLVYYQLVILVLLWLCLMLPYLWPPPPRAQTVRGPDAQAPLCPV